MRKISKDGRVYYLDDYCGTVVAKERNGKDICQVSFNFCEGDPWKGQPNIVSIETANTDANWRRQGVATACIEYARNELFPEIVFQAPSIADTAKINGNYLTGDGSKFIGSLRKKGWVSADPIDIEE